MLDDQDDEDSRSEATSSRAGGRKRGPRPRTPPPEYVGLLCTKMYRLITNIRTQLASLFPL